MQPLPFDYPMDSLAIIAPIIFIVLVVAFPLIGIFAGWKRGIFWGAGLLIFYIAGLLIWVFLGETIAKALGNWTTQLISQIMHKQLEPLPTDFVKSILTPFYFLIFMAVSVLILLINYYAWYKRAVGLKKIKVKDKKTGKIHKEYNKVNKKANKTSYKVANKFGGFLTLGLLTLPTTITFTQFAYVTTTTTATRETNNLSSGLYKGLNIFTKKGIEKCFYFKKDTFLDYDSLLSALSMLNKTVKIEDEDVSVIDVLKYGIGNGVANIFTSLSDIGVPTEFNIDAGKPDDELNVNVTVGIEPFTFDSMWTAVDSLAKYWNPTLAEYITEFTSFFASTNVLPTINSVLRPIIKQWFDFPPVVISKTEPFYIQLTEIPVEIDLPVVGPQTLTFNYDLHLFRFLFLAKPMTDDIEIPLPKPYEETKIKAHLNFECENIPIFDSIIQTYQREPSITKLTQIKIPKTNLDSIADLFNEFMYIDTAYEQDLKKYTGDESPSDILKTNIRNFLQCVFSPI